jgi:sulfur-oxidizing protein SoxY
MQRRQFLKRTLAGSAVTVAVAAGLLSPRRVLAAWPTAAFEAKSINEALGGLFGHATTLDSNDIEIKAPDIAENGAAVPVSVTTKIAGVTAIAILTSTNNTPLAANFAFGQSVKGSVSTRIKMAATADVVAIVKAGNMMYTNKKNVKVTIGGCGGG